MWNGERSNLATSKGVKRHLRSDFSLGGEQAEADPLLEAAFYDSGKFSSIKNQRNPHCFLIGRTGSGKSAILQHLEDQAPEHTIRINPEDLSLPYLLDLNVVQSLSNLGVHLDPFFIALWKHVLLVEIIRHRYSIDSPATKRNILTSLREAISRDTSKTAALDYLDQFGESFWCETDQRVKEITENFERSFDFDASAQLQLPGTTKITGAAKASRTSGSEIKSEEADRYQRIVNETQLARLNKMIAVLDEEILQSIQNFTYVVIDDLDRDWIDDDVANDLIRCLFRAVLDLQKVRHLKIVVALRSNIFEQLNFGSKTGGQEEKFRSLQIQMRWTRGELVKFADERARAASQIGEARAIQSIKDILPPTPRDGIKAIDYVLDRTLLRPRDLIAFLNECIGAATGRNRVRWADIDTAEISYSHQRLLALRDEWKPNFPGIERVIAVFNGAPAVMDQKEMGRRLTDAALLMAEPDFPGVMWMTELSRNMWNATSDEDWAAQHQEMVAFFYNLGVVGIRRPGRKTAFGHDQPDFATLSSNLNGSAAFVIHPMLRPALDTM